MSPTLLDALSGKTGRAGHDRRSVRAQGDSRDIGSDLSQQHPFLAFQIRANYRHHGAHIYTVTPGPVREQKHGGAQHHYGSWPRTRGRGIAARSIESRAGTGDRVWRRDQGRCGPQTGGVRRFARHSGAIRLPGGLFEFARRVRHGPVAQARPRLSGRCSEAGLRVRRNSRVGRSRRAVGGGRESAEARARSAPSKRFRGGERHVPHRNRAARRCGVPRRFGLRKDMAPSPTCAGKCSGSRPACR